VLRLEGVLNIRDLGGIAAFDGHSVALGRLYRSGSLHEMTGTDRSVLMGLGISTIIDLRSAWERTRQPYSLDGARLVHAPLVDGRFMASIVERFESRRLTSEEIEDWWTFIRVYQTPEEHLGEIRTVFAEILRAPPGSAVLFHCRGGKDRTGFIAALLLGALGVPRSGIARDFLLSNHAMHDGRVTQDSSRMTAMLQESGLSERAIESLTGVREEWLHQLLDGIAARYGSVASYVSNEVGIEAEGLTRLRQAYLDPPRPGVPLRGVE